MSSALAAVLAQIIPRQESAKAYLDTTCRRRWLFSAEPVRPDWSYMRMPGPYILSIHSTEAITALALKVSAFGCGYFETRSPSVQHPSTIRPPSVHQPSARLPPKNRSQKPKLTFKLLRLLLKVTAFPDLAEACLRDSHSVHKFISKPAHGGWKRLQARKRAYRIGIANRCKMVP